MQIDIINLPAEIDRQSIHRILTESAQLLGISLNKKIIEIKFVDDIEMQKLNQTYRQVNDTTDVLSFPQTENSLPNQIYGSVAISAKEASRRKETLDQLILHGFLHLAGYDHEKDTATWSKAAKLIGHNMGTEDAKI